MILFLLYAVIFIMQYAWKFRKSPVSSIRITAYIALGLGGIFLFSTAAGFILWVIYQQMI